MGDKKGKTVFLYYPKNVHKSPAYRRQNSRKSTFPYRPRESAYNYQKAWNQILNDIAHKETVKLQHEKKKKKDIIWNTESEHLQRKKQFDDFSITHLGSCVCSGNKKKIKVYSRLKLKKHRDPVLKHSEILFNVESVGMIPEMGSKLRQLKKMSRKRLKRPSKRAFNERCKLWRHLRKRHRRVEQNDFKSSTTREWQFLEQTDITRYFCDPEGWICVDPTVLEKSYKIIMCN